MSLQIINVLRRKDYLDDENISYHPEKFPELNAPRNLRIAEVFSEKHVKDFSILETVSHNRGYWVSVFSDVEKALQWLKK